MSYSLKSGYRFPYSFTRCYLRWRYWWRMFQHWYERMRYGVSFADKWNLDRYLARILIRVLPHYQNRNGESHLLYLLDEDNTENILATMRGEPWSDEQKQAAMDRWDAMIDEIIEGLKVDVECEDYEYVYSEAGQAKIDRAWQLFAENVRRMWD